MARSKDELKQYAADLAKEKGLPDNLATIGIAVMTGDKAALEGISIDDVIAAVGPMTDLAVGRQADYSRAMGEATSEKKKARTAYDENIAWKNKALPEFTQATADLKAAREHLAAYEKEYGSLDETVDIGGGKTVTASGKVVKTEDLDALRKEVKAETTRELAGQFMQFQYEEGQLGESHFARFKQPMNKAKLIEVMSNYANEHANDPANSNVPRVLSLTDAYNQVYGEQVTKLDVDARAAEIKAAEERGIAKGRTAAMGRSGAAVSEDSGAVFARIDAERKAGDKGVQDITDDEAAAAFNQDFEQFSRPAPDSLTQ